MEPIYQYASLKNAIDILKGNDFILSTPEDFNDVYDSVIKMSSRDIAKVKRIASECLYEKYILEKNIDQLPIIEKLNMNVHKGNIEREKYYSRDLSIMHLIKRFVPQFKDKVDLEIDNVVRKIEDYRSEVLISCFSKRYDSLLMWSHYGDKHKGVCIEIERPLFALDVKYSKNRKFLNIEKITRICLAYLFLDKNVDMNDERLIKYVSEPFILKSNDWKYEEEVRMIFSKKSENVYPKIVNGKEKYFYKIPGKISRIYLGCKINKFTEEYLQFHQLVDGKIDLVDLCASDEHFEIKAIDDK